MEAADLGLKFHGCAGEGSTTRTLTLSAGSSCSESHVSAAWESSSQASLAERLCFKTCIESLSKRNLLHRKRYYTLLALVVFM